ncbi:probable chitinase 10 [Cylas formicarius]|uniref:probable chitinase 10 n=1 Tax=Cylas formicarius TaxID=197179 RepID=UPI002958B548|nr:probable chitinase 10 [Cylas formicarius]
MMRLFVALALSLIGSNLVSAATKNIICYHGTWSHYRWGNGQFSSKNIDPTLCTHAIYTFVGIDANGNVILLDEWLDIDLGGFQSINALKQVNPNFKTLLAVGGWNEGSAKYSAMAADPIKRANFINTALSWVLKYGFDGFDLDWEYPARRDSSNAADKENFVTLIKELRTVFDKNGLLLTAAVSATPSSVDISYDVPSLSKNLDFINVMLYDFFGSWDTTTGHNAPLNGSTRYVGTEYAEYSVVTAIEGWLSRGADPQKIALGVPFYGRTFTLSNSNNNAPGASISGAGMAGLYTATAGFLGYNEIIEKFNAGGWTQKWDNEQNVPYAYSGNQWISYDNPKSLAIKARYAQSLNLGAVMLWSIETDDFLGLSGTKFPLLKAINEVLFDESSSSSSSDDLSNSNSDSESSSGTNSDDSSSSSVGASNNNTDDSNSSNTDNTKDETQSSDASDSEASDSSSANSGSSSSSTNTKNVICYHGTWSHYRRGNGQFSSKNIDPTLCTHAIYTFVGIDANGNVILLDEWLDIGLGGFQSINALKQVNPNFKTLLAVGGWNEGSTKYSAMAADPTKRANFINTALSWVLKYGFDGFDLDWEYPARRDSSNAADKENFVTLIKELRAVFDKNGLLLTAAVSATPSSVDISYDVPSLSKNLDFINVMLYDFFGSWDTTTGHNAPLNGSTRYVGTEYAEYSVVTAIEGWLSRGADPQKIALGVPFYGRTFTLSNSNNNAPGASISGAGTAGPYTATAGFLGYNEIIEKFNAGGWTQKWDNEQNVPYAYSGNQWISYDNPKSLAIKAKYAQSLNLGAVMLWSIETDDFLGLSGTKFPLLRAINDALGLTASGSSDDPSNSNLGGDSSNSESSNSDSSNSKPSNSENSGSSNSDNAIGSGSSSSSSNECTSAGAIRDSNDCGVYYICVPSGNTFVKARFTCPGELYYDISISNCNYPSLVSGC